MLDLGHGIQHLPLISGIRGLPLKTWTTGKRLPAHKAFVREHSHQQGECMLLLPSVREVARSGTRAALPDHGIRHVSPGEKDTKIDTAG